MVKNSTAKDTAITISLDVLFFTITKAAAKQLGIVCEYHSRCTTSGVWSSVVVESALAASLASRCDDGAFVDDATAHGEADDQVAELAVVLEVLDAAPALTTQGGDSVVESDEVLLGLGEAVANDVERREGSAAVHAGRTQEHHRAGLHAVPLLLFLLLSHRQFELNDVVLRDKRSEDPPCHGTRAGCRGWCRRSSTGGTA
jgi:hypothetical protein